MPAEPEIDLDALMGIALEEARALHSRTTTCRSAQSSRASTPVRSSPAGTTSASSRTTRPRTPRCWRSATPHRSIGSWRLRGLCARRHDRAVPDVRRRRGCRACARRGVRRGRSQGGCVRNALQLRERSPPQPRDRRARQRAQPKRPRNSSSRSSPPAADRPDRLASVRRVEHGFWTPNVERSPVQ